LLARLAAALVLALCAVVVGLEADHGVASVSSLISSRSVRVARLENYYYDCLSAEAMKLVPPGAPVEIPRRPPGAWITLAKAVDQWANLVRYPSEARVVLTLVDRQSSPNCLDRAVVAHPGGLVHEPHRTG
jgi:hypothetical protein